MAQVNDKKAEALHAALEAIRHDRHAFRADPERKVPALDSKTAEMFKHMSDLEYECLLYTDHAMQKAGFTIAVGNISVQMV